MLTDHAQRPNEREKEREKNTFIITSLLVRKRFSPSVTTVDHFFDFTQLVDVEAEVQLWCLVPRSHPTLRASK